MFIRSTPKFLCLQRCSLQRRCSTSASASDQHLLKDYDYDRNVAVLTLNNPQKRNVLSFSTLSAFKQYISELREEFNSEKGPRVVLIRANGSVFSSGHDLKELANATKEQSQKLFELCTEVMEGLQRLPQPVVAEVNGLATAAGCQLVATCDFVIASTNASFATPGVKTGLFCTTPGVAVARKVSPVRKALEMLLLGQAINAQEAFQYGLVNKVVAPDKLREEVSTVIQHLLRSSKVVLALGKRAFYEQVNMPQRNAYEYACTVMTNNLHEVRDAKEGIAAFFEKREPKWTNS
jgi:enoyl-CoA hydratase/carnithine racemase